MNSALQAVLPVFRTGRKFILTTHINPDGDGLGCEIALAEWLIARGRQVSILNDSATPVVYRFLDPNGRILQFAESRDAAALAAAEVIVVLDTNHTDRLRALKPHVQQSPAVKVCIDHHLDPEPFASLAVLDDEATSTGEIIYHLLLELDGNALSPLVAQALFCAIMTDTGSFRYPRVDPETFRIAAHLVECGADPVAIYSNVHERWTAGRMRLLGEMLAAMQTGCSGKLAHAVITREMLARTGTTEEDTDNFTTYPMSIAGVVAGILFLELERGVKISFRSRGDIPINELAKEFGGNGHRNAAGARLEEGPLHAVVDRVLLHAQRYVQP